MISKTLSVSLFVCALLLSSSLTMAYPGDQSGGKGDRQAWGQQLTPEQKKQAEKIFNDNFESMQEIRAALSDKRQELNSILDSDNPDPAKIESISREIGELRGKMLANRLAVRSQLTEKGLPEDFYGPGVGTRKQRNRGPEVWHGGHHGERRGHHHRWYGRGYGCPGMMGGCW